MAEQTAKRFTLSDTSIIDTEHKRQARFMHHATAQALVNALNEGTVDADSLNWAEAPE